MSYTIRLVKADTDTFSYKVARALAAGSIFALVLYLVPDIIMILKAIAVVLLPLTFLGVVFGLYSWEALVHFWNYNIAGFRERVDAHKAAMKAQEEEEGTPTTA